MNISATDLRRAADIKDNIEKLNIELSKLLSGEGIGNAMRKSFTGIKRPRRKMSVASKAKIAAAQRARWAKWKAKQK